MIEVVGQYNTAICYTGELEAAAAGQIQAVCDQPAFADSKIRIIPCDSTLRLRSIEIIALILEHDLICQHDKAMSETSWNEELAMVLS